MDFTHSGEILEVGSWQSKCKCGFLGKVTEYIYQSKEELFKHFKKVGTLLEDSDFGGWKAKGNKGY